MDESTTADDIRRSGIGNDVALFPVSDNWLHLTRLAADLAASGVSVACIDSARRVDAEITALRDSLPAWTDRLAEHEIDGRRIADHFSIAPSVSLYWLSSLAERNPLKTPEILAAAVARAFDAELRRVPYRGSVIALRAGVLAAAVSGIARAHGLAIASDAPRRSRLDGTKLQHAVLGLAAIGRQCLWAVFARGLRFAKTEQTADVLCVTYFPYIDRNAADEGRFVNRYVAPLQELFARSGVSAAWLGVFVFVDGWTFRDAVRLARRFRNSGARIALLDAYVSPRLVLRVLRDMWTFGRRAAAIERRLGSTLGDGFIPPGAESIALAIWRRAFNGLDLARSLTFAHAFQDIVRTTPRPGRVLYLAEFQVWEQALNSAAATAGWDTTGFQHTVVSRNHYFYFRTRREIAANGMPLPRRIAAGGELLAGLFRESGIDAQVVESIRQLHLAPVLRAGNEQRQDRALLVAGSIDRRETSGLLAMIAAAFPGAPPLPIRVKAHPSMPAEPLFRELGIADAASRFEIVSGTVGEWLGRSSIVLVGSSAVAVEALAYGCDVLVPGFASAPRLTPLAGWESFYSGVYSPQELAQAVADIEGNGPRRSAAEKRAFVAQYWSIDPDLPRWNAWLNGVSAQRNAI